MNYGHALKTIRESRNLSQGDAAKKAGVSQTYLSQVEGNVKKSPSEDIIKKLCKVYKIPPIIVTYMAAEKKDIPKSRKHLFDVLKPPMDAIINEYLKMK